jgi:hypothetical protein
MGWSREDLTSNFGLNVLSLVWTEKYSQDRVLVGSYKDQKEA